MLKASEIKPFRKKLLEAMELFSALVLAKISVKEFFTESTGG